MVPFTPEISKLKKIYILILFTWDSVSILLFGVWRVVVCFADIWLVPYFKPFPCWPKSWSSLYLRGEWVWHVAKTAMWFEWLTADLTRLKHLLSSHICIVIFFVPLSELKMIKFILKIILNFHKISRDFYPLIVCDTESQPQDFFRIQPCNLILKKGMFQTIWYFWSQQVL